MFTVNSTEHKLFYGEQFVVSAVDSAPGSVPAPFVAGSRSVPLLLDGPESLVNIGFDYNPCLWSL